MPTSGTRSQICQTGEPGEPYPGAPQQIPPEIAALLFRNTVALISYIRGARALRNTFLDPDLFGEPGWDILLDLYRAELDQQRLAISSIGLSSGIAPTTTIRWLNTLESKGLIRRDPDPLDARRIFASLTGETVRVLDAMFIALSQQLSKVSNSSLAVSSPQIHRAPQEPYREES